MLNSYYKYSNISTAKAVLSSKCFRFSSPLNFNDPFDIQTTLYTEFDVNNLTDIVLSRIEEYVTGLRELPQSQLRNDNSILQLRQAIQLTGMEFNQVKPELASLIEDVTNRIKRSVSYHNDVWLKAMRRTKVFCVTEAKDNLLMWAHYAQDHTGLVFEIANNIGEPNNIFSHIQKVNYGEKPVSYFNLNELFEWILFLIDPDFQKIMYSNYACYKSNHWEYEKEWRTFYLAEDGKETTLYFDCSFNPSQLKNITFGCKTDDKNIIDISEMAKLVNPNIEFYHAQKKHGDFGLDFPKI